MIDFEKIFEDATRVLAEPVDVEGGLTLGYTNPGGIAASATVIVSAGGAASSDPTTLRLSAQADVFEGTHVRSARAVWTAEEVVSDTVGVRAATSSINEGQFLVSKVSGSLRAIKLTEELELEDGWYSGDALDALVNHKTINESSNQIHAMARTATLAVSDTAAIEYLHRAEIFQGGDVSEVTISTKKISTLKLDGIYNDIRKFATIGLESATEFSSYEVSDKSIDVTVIPGGSSGITVPVTRIGLAGSRDLTYLSPSAVVVHFDPRKVGSLEYIPTKTVVPSKHILDVPRPVTLAADTKLPVTGVPFVIEDAEQTSLVATGNAYVDISGQTYVRITEIPEQGFEGELVKPITFHWGLTRVTRGATVSREVLGSGDASQPWQSFKLAKSPLTYVTDPAAPGGRRAEIEVYVDGVKWTRAPSFYAAGPSDRIYVIKHDDAHDTHVLFGDGELGARVSTGAANIVARYRYGVGGNVEAREINRIKVAVPGVRSVINPLAASGGEEPPTPARAREQMIQRTRVLGSLIALPDFEVEAKRWGGVVQAKARWGWDRLSDEALVDVWVIAPGPGDPSLQLQGYLQLQAEPGTRVRVRKAAAHDLSLSIQLEFEPNYLPEDVRAAVRERMFDDTVGYFSPRSADIGGLLRRADLYAALHEVPGVATCRVVRREGELPPGYSIPDGTYLAPSSIPLGANATL